MDERIRETANAPRWLAWAALVLLTVGVVSAGVVDARDQPDDGLVRAAGGSPRTVDVPSSSTTTVTSLPLVTSVPPPTISRSTTIPKAAAAVLAAIGSNAPPTTQPLAANTPTTRPAVTPTTAATTPTTTMVTTPTTVPRLVTVTVVNEHPNAVVVTVNGREFRLEPGAEVGPLDLPLPANGNDVVDVRSVIDPACGLSDVSDFFQAGGRYRLAIVATQGVCGIIPNFQLKVTPA